MLDEAARCGGNPLIASLESAWLYNDDNAQVDNLRQSLSGASTAHYTRYWHGYLVLVKPLLIIFNVQEIRLVFQIVFIVLVGLASVSISRICDRRGMALAIALCLSLGLVGSADAAATLPIFFSFAIALISVIWVSVRPLNGISCRKGSGFKGFANLFDSHLCVFFFIIGAITVFFDFLDNPLITLGMPLVVLVLRSYSQESFRGSLMICFACCIAWLLGYGLLWASKWVIASAVLGENAIGTALDQAIFRAGISEGGREYGGIGDALRRNFFALGIAKWVLALEILAVFVSYGILLFCRARISRKNIMIRGVTLLILIALLPMAWYVTMMNHSIIHAESISYRTQVIALFSLFAALIIVGDRAIIMIRDYRQGHLQGYDEDV
ncbi:hypothetical protein [Adlercreutzia murintestinalis]|uniref:hypothetical protein n=1 Tax=Adlercreutzia murintestinalis TaxID=2941325 RepID=UPI00203E58B4|nr:hypothetical protein [Adlercreutzia murintestinalis]